MEQLSQIKRNKKLLYVALYLEKDYHHEINISKHRLWNQHVRHHNRSWKEEKNKSNEGNYIKQIAGRTSVIVFSDYLHVR